MPPLTLPIRILVILASAAVLATALIAGPAAAMLPLLVHDAKPDWALFGFEVVTVVATVLGVLQGLGKFPSGPGLGLACVAGTIFVAAVLGWQGSNRQLGGVSLNPLLAVRVACALVLGGAGAWSVLSRRREALPKAIGGALLVMPVVIAAGAMMLPRGQRLAGLLMGSTQATQFVVASVAFLAATALLSAGVHLLIRAFEMGRVDERPISRSA